MCKNRSQIKEEEEEGDRAIKDKHNACMHMVTMRCTEIELFRRYYSVEAFEQLNATYLLCVFTFEASFYFLRQTKEKCALYINLT